MHKYELILYFYLIYNSKYAIYYTHCSKMKGVKFQMYQALDRPELEYAATACDTYHQSNNTSAMVQWRSARFVTQIESHIPGTVTGVLSEIQWPALQRHRHDARLYLFSHH